MRPSKRPRSLYQSGRLRRMDRTNDFNGKKTQVKSRTPHYILTKKKIVQNIKKRIQQQTTKNDRHFPLWRRSFIIIGFQFFFILIIFRYSLFYYEIVNGYRYWFEAREIKVRIIFATIPSSLLRVKSFRNTNEIIC